MFTLLGAEGKSLFFPEPASTFAAEVDWLYWVLFWISLICFIGIVVATVWFCVAFRKRPGYVGSPDALHNNALEITWTVIPSFIVVWIFGQGVVGFLDMMNPPKGTEDINVLAQQWAWTFTYPNGAISSEELHIPNNRPVKMIMQSKDVLHAFYIPAFRCKQDVVPGRYTYLWFHPLMETGKATPEELKAAIDARAKIAEEKKVKPTDISWDYTKTHMTPEGDKFFHLFCAEYCGQKHSMMNVAVVVHSEDGYQKWLAEAVKAPTEPVAHGEWLYSRKGCKACHSVDGSNNTGPTWKGSWGKEVPLEGGATTQFNEQYVRDSILDPQKQIHRNFTAVKMNSYQGQLKDQDINDIIAYMKTLAN